MAGGPATRLPSQGRSASRASDLVRRRFSLLGRGQVRNYGRLRWAKGILLGDSVKRQEDQAEKKVESHGRRSLQASVFSIQCQVLGWIARAHGRNALNVTMTSGPFCGGPPFSYFARMCDYPAWPYD
jgi:hypothetical protein